MRETARFSVGSIECQIVSDGSNAYAVEDVFAGVPLDDVRGALGQRLDQDGRLVLGYNPLLIRTGGKLVLVDTGAGRAAQELGVPAGRLEDSLRHAGVTPDDVDVVIITHGHPDHIGGLTRSSNGQRIPVFASARHYVWRTEWAFWTSAALGQLPDFLAGPARLHLPPIERAGLLHLVDTEIDVLPGVRLVPAPGHTPGHMVVTLTSGNDKAIFAADAVIHELNFEHPDWVSAFDADARMTVETRRSLLLRIAGERRLLIAFHLDRVGKVEIWKDAFRFHARR